MNELYIFHIFSGFDYILRVPHRAISFLTLLSSRCANLILLLRERAHFIRLLFLSDILTHIRLLKFQRLQLLAISSNFICRSVLNGIIQCEIRILSLSFFLLLKAFRI